MNHDLAQLKKLVADFDDSDRELVNGLEKQLEEAVARDDLAKHVTIVAFRDYLESEMKMIDLLLLTKDVRDLPDRERQYLLDKKRLYERFNEAFGGESQRPVIEAQIQDYLRNANAQL